MAKDLLFKFKDNEFPLSPTKIDRKKLYGWTEVAAFDDDGNECKIVNMDDSGTVIIPKGGIGLGCVDSHFCWVDKSQLMAVNKEGNAATLLPSSFSGSIELTDTVSVEEFLDHSITAVYELEGAVNFPQLVSEAAGKIYSFKFNFREGYESSPAFLIENEGKLFMLVGVKNDFVFSGLDDSGYLAEDEEDEEQSDDLGIDFGMM